MIYSLFHARITYTKSTRFEKSMKKMMRYFAKYLCTLPIYCLILTSFPTVFCDCSIASNG